MIDRTEDPGRKELLKSAYRKIEELRARLAAAESQKTEPIAVVGMGCRFPGGVSDPDSFWQLLSTGTDGVTEIPADRWNVDDWYSADPDAHGKMYVRRGGFINHMRGFDPLFFHLSPQEASSMDPQQRVLLEVTWEALENAGIAPDRLAGTATGVFVGVATSEYTMVPVLAKQELLDMTHFATGGSNSIAAGRLSYFLGLHGPCMSVDTACASALTSLHLAVQSLRRGECGMALAGSVNLIMLPIIHVALCKARMLSADGKCKTFDAAADGYVRGEGCGMLVLKRLSQAQADGDRILAVIRGTACNQDGRTNGITAPNGNAQREVIQAALAESGLKAGDVDYVETHGTGTSLGDPVEIQALGQVFGPDRPADRKLVLGAVKTNIGHLETAAGIAGISKVILALQKEQIPPNLHLNNPNPLIPWDALPFKLPTELVPWPGPEKPGAQESGAQKVRVAGVSAFGFSGTNVHMVVEQAPPSASHSAEQDRPCHVLALSAQAPQALSELVDRYIAYFSAHPSTNLGDICSTANVGRTHFAHRLAAIATTLDELKVRLAGFGDGTPNGDSLYRGRAPTQAPQLGLFIAAESFSEVHWQLYHRSPAFRSAIDACDSAATELLGTSFSANLWIQPLASAARMASAQPTSEVLSFTLSYAMAALWREWGLNPATVSGHGVGRWVAAVIAGAITLRDGLQLAVGAKSGNGSAIAWSAPQIRLLSPLTGLPAGADYLTHPAENGSARHSPEWLKLTKGFKGEGTRVLLAIGTLSEATDGVFQLRSDSDVTCIAARNDGWSGLLNALGNLYTAGMPIDWQKVESPWRRQRLALPTYPFQRQDCWLKFKPGSIPRTSLQRELHPLLGRRVYSPRTSDEIVFEAEFNTDRLPLLLDHRFFSTVVVPAAAQLEMANAAGRLVIGQSEISLDDLVIEQPLLLPDGQTSLVQTVLTPEKGGGYSFVITSAEMDKLDGATPWKRHFSGKVAAMAASAAPAPDSGFLQRLQSSHNEIIDIDECYKKVTESGAVYGPTFRIARSVSRASNSALVFVKLPRDAAHQSTEYGMYPGILDAAFQSLGTAYPDDREDTEKRNLYMPIAIDGYRLSLRGLSEMWCHATIRSVNKQTEMFHGDVTLYTAAGQFAGELRGIHYKLNARKQLVQEMDQRRLTSWLFETRWEPIPSLPATDTFAGTWLVLANGIATADDFADVVRQRGGRAMVARPGSRFSEQGNDNFPCRFNSLSDVNELIRAAIDPGGSLRGVVYFAPGSTAVLDGENSVPLLASLATEQLLQLTLALAHNEVSDLVALGVITEGFQSPNIGIRSSLSGSAVWGLARTIATELPDLHCKMIDLQQPLPARKAAEMLADELSSGSDENQVVLAEGKRQGLRLMRTDTSIFGRENSRLADPDAAVELEFAARGDFRELRFVPQQAQPPGAGEVQLRVLATAMNFRDVLNVLGLYPGDPGPLGIECVGEIAAMGPEVSGWSIGERVLALPRGAYRTYAYARADTMFRCPAELSNADAATLLIAYLTAAYSLCTLGRMKAGDRVLIHAAAGGVGLAAVQLAQQAGAEIFATAGSPAKREYLRQIGVSHVMDSRSIDFAAEIRQLTAGQGIDLILNSLTGQAISEAMSLLRPGGSFLEIGKNELLTKEQVSAINADVNYHVIDLVNPLRDTPEVVQDLYRSIIESITAGTLRPLPHRTFSLNEAPQAFRYMAGAKHIGKVVVMHPTMTVPTTLEPTGTYLITGGLGGLGLLVARWMVTEGARRIVLVGRNAPNPSAEKTIRELEALGATIVEVSADIGDRAQVADLLKTHISPSAPLRGVIHAAGVLDDGALLLQDWQRFERVLKPKIDGAWNLHELTLPMPLDFFVMFSSAAGLLGNPGQSSYAAGNVFLDELAMARRNAGLPALSINWGAWAEVGMAAAMNERHTKGFDSRHMPTISPTQGITLLQMLIGKPQITQMAVLPIEESAWRELARHAVPPLIKNLVAVAGTQPVERSADNGKAAERLRLATPEKKREVMIELIHEMALDVFGVDRRMSIPPDQTLTTLGMDSLLAIQLSNRLKTSFSTAVPPTLTFQYPTIEAIADYLLNALSAVEQDTSASEVATPAEETTVTPESLTTPDPREAQAILANLNQLSDREVDAMLSTMECEGKSA